VSQAVVATSSLVGVEAHPVEVQADVSRGLPCFTVVGLADAAVLEARDRVRSAVRAAGFEFPAGRIVVNLAPAPLRKHGTGFDLPIALALLRATGQVPESATHGARAVGELALDGTIRGVPGVLAHALACAAARAPLACPEDCAAQVRAVPGLECHPAHHLGQFRHGLPEQAGTQLSAPGLEVAQPDLAEVRGHASAKRVLEISAAGGLNVLMSGPPGSGKTMLARRLPGILPALGEAERLETAAIHSVAALDVSAILAGIRPFRAPHHSASVAGLVGGGSPPRPGEVSLAHNGVLFLDELPEFGPCALQALRQPLEDSRLTLVRAEGRVTYPARFALVAAMNPCPCGFMGDPDRACTCAHSHVQRYQSRVGGPLLDRIDLFTRVDRVDPGSLLGGHVAESSRAVRGRVVTARAAMKQRGSGETRHLSGVALLSACRLDRSARRTLEQAARTLFISGRGVTRLLRVSRTIADLSGCERVGEGHVLEALCYRSG
jgi:magnesium chelatase family protein